MCVCVNFYLSKLCFWGLINWLVFSALTLLVRWQEENPTCKYGGVGCWRVYLSGARCRLAYAPADAIATHCLLTDTRLTAFFPGLPRWAGTRNVNPIWILLNQETVSGSSISWAIRKSAPRSRQITMPAIHHSLFTGRMPFLPPNQHRQSTEGISIEGIWYSLSLASVKFRQPNFTV